MLSRSLLAFALVALSLPCSIAASAHKAASAEQKWGDAIYIRVGPSLSDMGDSVAHYGAITDVQANPVPDISYSEAKVLGNSKRMTNNLGDLAGAGIRHWLNRRGAVELEFVRIRDSECSRDSCAVSMVNRYYSAMVNGMIAEGIGSISTFYIGMGVGIVNAKTDGFYFEDMTLDAQGTIPPSRATITGARTKVNFQDISSLVMGMQCFVGVDVYIGPILLGANVKYLASPGGIHYKFPNSGSISPVATVILPSEPGIVYDPDDILSTIDEISSVFFQNDSAVPSSNYLMSGKELRLLTLGLSIGYSFSIF